MPSFSTSFRFSTSSSRSCVLASRRASSARYDGVQWLPGRLAHSRASATPAAMASPQCRPSRTAAACAVPQASVTRSSFGAAGADGFVWRYT